MEVIYYFQLREMKWHFKITFTSTLCFKKTLLFLFVNLLCKPGHV